MKNKAAREFGVLSVPGAVCLCVVLGLTLALSGGRGYCAAKTDESASGNPYSGQTVGDVEKTGGPAAGKTAATPPGFPGVGVVIRMCLWLAVVLVCIYAAVYFIRRYVPSARSMFGGGVLKVVGRTYVSSRQSILLVKVGARFVVVGVSGAGMAPLAEISDPEEVRKLSEELAAQGGRGIADSFKKALSRADKDYAGGEEPPKAKNTGESAVSDMRQELDAVRKKVNWWRRRARD